MKQLNVFVATLVLTCFAFLPATARAANLDDLEVTMEVMDNVADFDFAMAEMRGPEALESDGDMGGESDDDGEDDHGEDEPDHDESVAGLDDEESDHGEDGDAGFGDDEEELEEHIDDFEDDGDFDEEDLDEEDEDIDDEGEDIDDDEIDEDDDDDDDGMDDDTGDDHDDDTV